MPGSGPRNVRSRATSVSALRRTSTASAYARFSDIRRAASTEALRALAPGAMRRRSAAGSRSARACPPRRPDVRAMSCGFIVLPAYRQAILRRAGGRRQRRAPDPACSLASTGTALAMPRGIGVRAHARGRERARLVARALSRSGRGRARRPGRGFGPRISTTDVGLRGSFRGSSGTMCHAMSSAAWASPCDAPKITLGG